jgi:hypothetical protein
MQFRSEDMMSFAFEKSRSIEPDEPGVAQTISAMRQSDGKEAL